MRFGTLSIFTACILICVGARSAVYGAESPRVRMQPSVVTGPVWPTPPEAARVRFAATIEGASDWGVERNWWGRLVDTLTGRHETQFVRPTGVAERDGVLYVADPGAQSVVIFDAPRHKEVRLTRAGDRMLVSPVAVAPGLEGTVYVADSRLQQVLQFDRDGRLLHGVHHDELQRPSAIAFDATRHRLYVGDSKAHVVHVFDEQGQRVASFGGPGAAPGEFNSPTHLAVTPDGSVVVTDALNFRVQVFGADGQYRYQLGKLGDGAGNFAAPKGVAIDRAGYIYVADALFDVVQVFDTAGRLLLGFGEQGRQAGQFWIPNGLFIDTSDRLFVADAYNRRVQVFQILTGIADSGAAERGLQQ